MTRGQFAATLVALGMGVVLDGCSRGPSGLIDYDVCEKRPIAHGRLFELQVVVSSTAAEEKLRALDEYLADKYDVRPGGKGHTIFYVDRREAVPGRPEFEGHCVAIHNVEDPQGFRYIPPGER